MWFRVVLKFYVFHFSDGRHFKTVYGKDLVDTLISHADQIAAELERSTPDRLVSHQNQASALQGQIDLLKSHQAVQDRRIDCAVARAAEEADGRSNERFVVYLGLRLGFFFCFDLV